MESLAFLAFLVPLAGVGVVVLFIIAVIQQSRHEHTGGFKQAFFTVVSLVMLSITVGSLIAILTSVSKEYVFPDAVAEYERYNPPPTLFIEGTVKAAPTEAYTCTDDCQFTPSEKAQFTSWKQNYESWKNAPLTSNDDFRRNLVGPLSFLIVGLPLYLVFMRLMERGAKQELAELKKATSLRQLYFYFVAFAGLLIAVIGAGSLVNSGLKTLLNTETTPPYIESPALIDDQGHGPQSVINCAEACGFTAEDVALAEEWKTDYKQYQENLKHPSGQVQNDLANNLPLLLVGLPLFWYHFARIRKETGDINTPPTKPIPATS